MKVGLSIGIALLVVPAEAPACLVGEAFRAYVHSALPTPLPSGTIIAFVDFSGASEADLNAGVSARVERMVQGDYTGERILLKGSMWTSCDNPFDNGKRGYIVGRPNGYQDGVLVIDPILVTKGDGFRLPDGYQLKTGRSDAFDWDPVTLEPRKPKGS